jgi:hypothetical protein
MKLVRLIKMCFNETYSKVHTGKYLSDTFSVQNGPFVLHQRESRCLAYYLTLKMEATCSSETSVDFQLTTQLYIPEDRTLQEFFYLPSHLD